MPQILDQKKSKINPHCIKVASVKNYTTLYTEDKMAKKSLMD